MLFLSSFYISLCLCASLSLWSSSCVYGWLWLLGFAPTACSYHGHSWEGHLFWSHGSSELGSYL